MLVQNVTLKEIGLFGNFHVKSRDVFLRILQHQNFVLEDLLLDTDFDAEINYYLNLNRSGRYKLLRNDNQSQNQWLESMVSLQKDMDCDSPEDVLSSLFYFVKAKPLHLVAHASSQDDEQRFIREMRLLKFQTSSDA